MKSLDQYKDYEAFLQDAKNEGLAVSFKDRQALEVQFSGEMDIRTMCDRIEKFLKLYGSVSRSDLYRRLNLNRHPKVAEKAILRLRITDKIYERSGEAGRGRKGKVLVYGNKTVEVSDERYNELIARAGFSSTEKVVDTTPASEKLYTGSPNWIGPGGVPTAVDSLDQLIDSRKAAQ